MARVRGVLLDTDYVTVGGRAWLRLSLRTDRGHVFVHDASFEPYFYAVPARGTDAARLADGLRTLTAGDATVRDAGVVERWEGLDRVRVVRVVAGHPGDVPALRTKVRSLEDVASTREDDIVFASRYVIDRGLSPLGWIEADAEPDERVHGGLLASDIRPTDGPEPSLHVLAFDLEVYNPRIQPDAARDPIVAISLASDRGFEQVLSKQGDSDKPLLQEFIAVVKEQDPDVLVTYNGDNFDWPYLSTRCRIHGVPLRVGRDGSEPQYRQAGRESNVLIAGRGSIDAYRIAARDLGDVKVKTLKNVAEHLGVMALDERTMVDRTRMAELWDDPDMREDVLEYALDDARSALRIAQRLLPLQVGLCRRTRQGLSEGTRMGRGRQVDWYLLAEAHKRGLLAPSRDAGGAGGGGQYEGAVVLKPPRGVFEDVVYLDFSSMYPSIMLAYNISPETLVAGTAPPGVRLHAAPEVGHRFRAEPDGFFPSIVRSLITARRAAREAGAEVEQQVLKVLTNSFYGYMGWAGARWYRRECAEATSAWGRHFIGRSADIARSLGLEVLYGDTDSLMVKKSPQVATLIEKVNAELPVELDIEDEFKVLFFTGAKKRYAGLSTDGRVVVRGLEVRRGDWCELAKQVQRDVIAAVLRDKKPESAVELARLTIQRLRSGDVPLSELTIHKTLTMDPEKYKGKQAHVGAIEHAMRQDPEYKPPIGAKVGFVIVKTGRRDALVSERARLVESLGPSDAVDADYYVENQVAPAALRVLEYFGVTEADLAGGPGQKSLKDWFG